MTRRVMVPVLALVLVGGCSREAPPAPAAPASAAPSEPATAQAVLDGMDERAVVPLLPMMANHQKQNMREHLVAVQEIVGAVARDDFASVERAAGRIGFSEQMGQMCSHMGAGAPGFTEQALAFHHSADEIVVAAKKHDRAEVLRTLDATLKSCTSCHAAWKQQVVDEAAWQRLTSSAPPRHGGGH